MKRAYPYFEDFYKYPSIFGNLEEASYEIPKNIREMKIREIMTKNPVTITPETSLLKALALKFTKKVGRLPVVQDGKVVGILDSTDLFHALVSNIIN